MNTSASNAQVDLLNFVDVLKWIHKLIVRNAAVMKQNVVSVRLHRRRICWCTISLCINKQSVQLSKLLNGLVSP